MSEPSGLQPQRTDSGLAESGPAEPDAAPVTSPATPDFAATGATMFRKVRFPLRLLKSGWFWLWTASLCNLAAVVVLWYWVVALTDGWWLSAVLQFTPRAPFAVPSLLLGLLSVRVSKWTFACNALAVALVCGPIMQWTWPASSASSATIVVDSETTPTADGAPRTPLPATLRVISCNVADFTGDFDTTVAEVRGLAPDLVALQESTHDGGALAHNFADWFSARHGEFWLGSRYPTRVVQAVPTIRFGRWYHVSAVLFRVELPTGPILVCNTHLQTARPMLMRGGVRSWLNGSWQHFVRKNTILRQTEAEILSQVVADSQRELPVLMPTTSGIFREYWSQWTVAFDQCGFGYGYTAPCFGVPGWPNGLPWVRIDHILTDRHWRPTRSVTGSTNGSDHRLVFAELEILPTAVASPAQSNSNVAEFPDS